MLRVLVAILLSLTVATPALAEWKEASSAHFVIYSDQSEKRLRQFATQLESFHSAMEFVTGKRAGNISPSNRVTVYVVGSPKTVKRLYGDNRSNVAGFYISRAGGSAAFIPDVQNKGGKDLAFSEIVLLHEYAHHFMFSNYGVSFPDWYTEGFAEFYASAGFKSDGSVALGRPANHRAGELFQLREIPIEVLLDTEAYANRKKPARYDSFYGHSWLLYHYLLMESLDPDAPRNGQLSQYLANLLAGQQALEAARGAFGDLAALDRDRTIYLKRGRLMSFQLPADRVSVGPIAIRDLSAGASEAMSLRYRSRRGVDTEQAAEIVIEARQIAAQYPNDPFVQATLAEAEYDAGHNALAIAAANVALAAQPGNIDAHIQKIYATFRSAQGASKQDEAAAWAAVQSAIVAANKQENDHPIPLMHYYYMFHAQGKDIPEIAKKGLEQALGLAPYDKELRMQVAMQQIADGRYTYARATLARLLLDPHNSGAADAAETLLAKIADRDDRVTDDISADNAAE